MTLNSMSAMAEMSRAIRLVCWKHGPTLQVIPDDVLRDLAMITSAYAADLRDEMKRRGLEIT